MRIFILTLSSLGLLGIATACGVKGSPEPMIPAIPQPRLIKKPEKELPGQVKTPSVVPSTPSNSQTPAAKQ